MALTVLQPDARGFDTASRLTPAVLDAAKADGISFVVKYVPYGSNTSAKMWTAAEVKLCFDRDLALLAVWETQGTRALSGPIGGWADGSSARAGMRTVGYPDELFILAAVDYDVYSHNSVATLGYAHAFGSTCGGGLACYGDEDVADGLIGSNPIICLPNAWGWSRVLAATSAAGRIAAARGIPGVCIYQLPSGPHYGINVDPLLVLQPVRAWVKNAPAPAPAPTPAPSSTSSSLAATIGGTDVLMFVQDSDNPADGTRWVCNGIAKRHVTGGTEIAELVAAGLLPSGVEANPRQWDTALLNSYPTV